MTDADARLKALFAADVPPAMDARFRLAAMERIERRRMGGQMAVLAARRQRRRRCSGRS